MSLWFSYSCSFPPLSLPELDSIPGFNLLHPRSPCCSCLERSCVCNSPDKVLILLFVVCFDPIVTSFTFSLLFFVTIFDLKTCASDRAKSIAKKNTSASFQNFQKFQARSLEDQPFASFLSSYHLLPFAFILFTSLIFPGLFLYCLSVLNLDFYKFDWCISLWFVSLRFWLIRLESQVTSQTLSFPTFRCMGIRNGLTRLECLLHKPLCKSNSSSFFFLYFLERDSCSHPHPTPTLVLQVLKLSSRPL